MTTVQELRGLTCIAYKHGWGSYVCGKPAKTLHRRGPFCGIHNPAKREKRLAEREAEWNAREAASQQRRADATLLITKLGLGSKQHGSDGWTGNVILTPEEVETVLSWREPVRERCDIEQYKADAEARGER